VEHVSPFFFHSHISIQHTFCLLWNTLSIMVTHEFCHPLSPMDADTVVSSLTDDSAFASQKSIGDGVQFNDDVLFVTMTNGDCRLIKMVPQPEIPSLTGGHVPEKINRAAKTIRLSLGFTPLSKASTFIGKRISKHHKTTSSDDTTAVITAAEYSDFIQ
jgi:hypothetical protein